MPIVYLNDEYIDKKKAQISIFDSSVIFGDSIYEATYFEDGKIIDLDYHIERFTQSADKVFIQLSEKNKIKEIITNLIIKNPDIKQGLVYLQLTRGLTEDRYAAPMMNAFGNLFGYIVPSPTRFKDCLNIKLKVKLIPDPRRERCDIKMNSLMPVKIARLSNPQYNYLFFKSRINNNITEGENANIFIVKDGLVRTNPLSNEILPGCTRRRVINILKEKQIPFSATPFTENELFSADEIFITKSTAPAIPIDNINGEKVGDQKEISTLIHSEYLMLKENTKSIFE